MSMMVQCLLAAGMLVGSCMRTIAANAPNMGTTQTAKEFKYGQGANGTIHYLLFLPQGYANEGGKRWPLMLFLHGAGE